MLNIIKKNVGPDKMYGKDSGGEKAEESIKTKKGKGKP